MAIAGGLFYEEFGAGRGAPLILSSGLGGSARYWEGHVEGLVRPFNGHPGHRIIGYDHRGTGRSDRTLPDLVTVEDLARDILELMDALSLPKATVIGHAAGGVAGLALALIAPERVERLVVINGWCKPNAWFERCFEMRLALLRGSGPEAYIRAQPLFLYPQNWLDGSEDERLVADEMHALAQFPGVANIEKRVAALAAFDIRNRLSEITVPVLCLGAFDDMLVPWTETVDLACVLPNATRYMFSYGAHALNLVNPDRFEHVVLAWLADQPLPEE